MGKRIYNWKRFWVKREGEFNLSDGGYLIDPDTKWGRFYNRGAVALSTIARSPCLVLLGEPGIGKSTAIKSEFDALETQASAKRLFLDLREVGSDWQLNHKLFSSSDFQSWKNGDHPLHLFLDSLDECLLRVDTVANILLEELRCCPTDRLYLRIACRTADWPDILERGLLDSWQEDHIAVYKLAPLRRRDVREAAERSNLDAGGFLKAIDGAEGVPFAIKPVTLEFLLNVYAKEGELPKTRTELYDRGCSILCEEQNASRRGAKLYPKLTLGQGLAVSSRIAAVTIFSKKYAVWTGPDLGDVPEEDITIQALSGGTESVDGVAFEVTDNAVRETLATGLFLSRGAGRMGWSHQTYAEFLAAKYLADKKMALHQIVSLIMHPSDPGKRLVPQLQETAAWLASLNQEVFQEIIGRDPEALLGSDIATGDDRARSNLVISLLSLIEREEAIKVASQSRGRFTRLKHPGLGAQLRPVINDESRTFFVRSTAIDIAEACEVQELQGDLAAIALASRERIEIRTEAAYAVYRLGDTATRSKMLSLAKGAEVDARDQLKGWALHALWPDLVGAAELFALITVPKNQSFHGPYQHFLKYELAKYLQPLDMPVALSWTERAKRGQLRSGPIESLKDEIMLKAWEYLDSHGVLAPFAGVALGRMKNFDQIVRDDLEGSFQKRISADSRKRHKLLKAIIELVAKKGGELSHVIHGGTRLALDEDFNWMIERLAEENSVGTKRTWAKFLRGIFRWSSAAQVNAILSACQSIPILAEVFDDLLKPVVLDSEEAQKLKETYRMMMGKRERDRPPVTPPPSERIASLLEEIEAGNPDAWWRLNMEMTLEPDSLHYGPEHETSLRKLPGWNSAGRITRRRILDAARRYVQEGDPHPNVWLENQDVSPRAVSALRALILVTQEDPQFLESFPPEIWKKWVPAIIANLWSSNTDDRDALKVLVKKAYDNAPDEVLNMVRNMVEKEDREYGRTFTVERMEFCWDTRLEMTVLEIVKDGSLSPRSVGNLASGLVRHRSWGACRHLRSLLGQSTPEGKRSDLAFFAARALLEEPETNWPFVWPVLQADDEFGGRVIESVSYKGLGTESIFNSLTEQQLAELFVWLSRKYPPEQDPRIDKGQALDPRGIIANWRGDALRNLEQRGTPAACEAIGRIMEELPHLQWLKWHLLTARALKRLKTWNPPEPKNILDLARSADHRLIENGEQLLDAIVESLDRLQAKVQGETPQAALLWDKVEKRKFKPKDEGMLSDYVKVHLHEDLKGRGIVVNREVEVRRIEGIGERTDIHVDAVIKKPDGEVYDQIKVVIETKGCWNKELKTAMETQLAGQYLDEAGCLYGLYLVGWYKCDLWTRDDSRKKRAPRIGLENARELFEKQAFKLCKGGKVVRAFLLDMRLKN